MTRKKLHFLNRKKIRYIERKETKLFRLLTFIFRNVFWKKRSKLNSSFFIFFSIQLILKLYPLISRFFTFQTKIIIPSHQFWLVFLFHFSIQCENPLAIHRKSAFITIAGTFPSTSLTLICFDFSDDGESPCCSKLSNGKQSSLSTFGFLSLTTQPKPIKSTQSSTKLPSPNLAFSPQIALPTQRLSPL